MRMRRYKLEFREAVYHVCSRVVDRQFKFDDQTKNDFQKILWKVATFSGVELITYVLMTDHFHVLVRVHPKWTEVGQEEVLRRVGVLYGGLKKQWLKNKLAYFVEAKDNTAAEALLDSYRSRMNDISEFMKTLKLRMTINFNIKHNREGTLWEGRFHSVLLEDSIESKLLRFVAAYIDLNPVRAGMVGDSGSYRWCGYANACGSSCWAEQGGQGIASLYAKMPEESLDCYGRFLRARAAKKGLVKASRKTEGSRMLTDVHVRNDALVRSRLIGSRAFIENVAGKRPAGGVTSFESGDCGPLLVVGRFKKRSKLA